MVLEKLLPIQGISNKAKKEIEDNYKYVEFTPGQPINDYKIISSNIHIIVEGEARLIASENNKPITIARLSRGTPLGLSSLLRG